MRLEELNEAMKGGKGTYVAVRFSKDTQDNLSKFIKDHDIPNPTPKDEYHATVIYSKKRCEGFEPHGELDDPWIGTPEKLEIFKTQDGKNALVLRFKSKELTERHHYIMDEYDATYDFPEYKIHATISYDAGDFDPKTIKDIKKVIEPLEIVEEYMKDLDG